MKSRDHLTRPNFTQTKVISKVSKKFNISFLNIIKSTIYNTLTEVKNVDKRCCMWTVACVGSQNKKYVAPHKVKNVV